MSPPASGPWSPPIVFKCGCKVKEGDNTRPLFVKCRLHRAAPDLLDLLEGAISIIGKNTAWGRFVRARVALAKAKA
jgi:hypothetical protein